ncbi:hypothetical protein [Sphingobacterium sp. LRF_L2]|uniref:hypothetical protein n=1 Tax=Sphingobacterium sp. LRF_L2 TaxID=3369421 RepID=UPI003F5DCFEE
MTLDLLFFSPPFIFILAVWLLTRRTVKAAFREYIDFYLEQNELTLEYHRVLWFSSGKFRKPWYEILKPMTPMGSSSTSMYIDLYAVDKNGEDKQITCCIKSHYFDIIDADFRE